ncbi:large-conductance mechanosensitive channel [Gordonia araii NBRC 100433]|uniref:Large-conductance mechanosensitive channel n=1 Tax=Gordonia araii NBRC 100433 TaxID=1073574 RepID=G7H3M6_9ACTN|nr:large conductance mechanosensitive channel protein MscL [Gordonia araii]NNG96568.1 large conductance mechanosensitive channel protein MscL [Gordonia araii NBRC 100433]GAB10451.1 large-conductance mechanosensitive channel [Gordonia araii NBRC 100433]
MLKGFREFILRGNVVELATAVIIGAAFTKIVEAFTDKVVQPLINSIPGGDPSQAAQGLGFCIGECRFPNPDNANPANALNYIDLSAVITAAINFLIVAAVVYFIIVLPYNKLSSLVMGEKEGEDTEVSLLTEIRNLMDPEAAEKAEAEKAAKARAAAAEQLPPPPSAPAPPPSGPGRPGAAAPTGEPMIRPAAGGPPSGALPRYEPGGYPTGSQPPVTGGGYQAPPSSYPGSQNLPPGGYNAPPGYPQQPGTEFGPGDHPGRHSR